MFIRKRCMISKWIVFVFFFLLVSRCFFGWREVRKERSEEEVVYKRLGKNGFRFGLECFRGGFSVVGLSWVLYSDVIYSGRE